MSYDGFFYRPSRSYLYNAYGNNVVLPFGRSAGIYGGYLNNLYLNSYYPDNLTGEWTWPDAINAARYARAVAPYYYYPYAGQRYYFNYYVPGTTTAYDRTNLHVNAVQISTDATVSVDDWLARGNTAVHYGNSGDRTQRPTLLFCTTGKPRVVDASQGTPQNPVLVIDDIAYQCA